jgi:hypothetical protein
MFFFYMKLWFRRKEKNSNLVYNYCYYKRNTCFMIKKNDSLSALSMLTLIYWSERFEHETKSPMNLSPNI